VYAIVFVSDGVADVMSPVADTGYVLTQDESPTITNLFHPLDATYDLF